jgi:hypothetical protein
MKRILAEDDPPLVVFDENLWIERLDPQEMPVEEGVNLFVSNRRWMTRILRRRPAADFARAGIHSLNGRKTLADVLAAAANHVDAHLAFLYGKRANLGVSIYPKYTRSPDA